MKRAGMVLIVLFVFCLHGYSQQALAAENEGISLFTLPAAVQAVVQREFPEAILTEIDEGEFDGKDVYEIEGRSADGMDFELEIGKDGTVYQKDEKVLLKDLPPAVLDKLKGQLGDVSPDNLKRMSEYGMVYYEIEAEGRGKEVELKIKTRSKPTGQFWKRKSMVKK
jgi:uncharacterized membrane protein YkoI